MSSTAFKWIPAALLSLAVIGAHAMGQGGQRQAAAGGPAAAACEPATGGAPRGRMIGGAACSAGATEQAGRLSLTGAPRGRLQATLPAALPVVAASTAP